MKGMKTMGYTKEQRAANAAKKAEQDNSVATENITKPKIRKIKLEDTTLVRVKNNVFGKLFYKNSRTGDEYSWESHDDVQDLYISDLREMKGTQRSFYSKNWIMIEGLTDYDEENEDVTVEDIYNFLQVQQYYKDVLCPDNLPAVLNMPINELKEKVPKMSEGVRLSLIILANTQITDGVLDSLNKIKALEELFGCELTRPE
jgi:hypothetical protein